VCRQFVLLVVKCYLSGTLFAVNAVKLFHIFFILKSAKVIIILYVFCLFFVCMYYF